MFIFQQVDKSKTTGLTGKIQETVINRSTPFTFGFSIQ
jgi:hypothetical protein